MERDRAREAPQEERRRQRRAQDQVSGRPAEREPGGGEDEDENAEASHLRVVPDVHAEERDGGRLARQLAQRAVVATAALVDERGGGDHADGPEEPGAQLHAQQRQADQEPPERVRTTSPSHPPPELPNNVRFLHSSYSSAARRDAISAIASAASPASG
eukprot:scaffold3630_cov76-Isochrysis_galbana.AAC.2